MTNALGLLKQLMEIPSTSGEETEVCQFVFDLLTENGFQAKKYAINNKRFNIVAKLNENPKIYLQAHLDTVTPFIKYSEDDENIYGRGSCDTKGSAACMITAGVLAKEQGLKNFGLIFTIEEETTLNGAKNLMNSDIEIPFVIVGEPSSLEIVNEHYGLLVIKIKAKGKSAHSSKPEEGINAIDILLEVIEKIKSLEIHPKTLMSLVQINGSIADNIIPPNADAIFSFRLAPEDTTNYFEQFSAFSSNEITFEKTIGIPGVHTNVPAELDFIKVRRTVKYFTELSFFKKGVIIGLGDIKYAHGPDERISKEELSKAIEVYSQILQNFN